VTKRTCWAATRLRAGILIPCLFAISLLQLHLVPAGAQDKSPLATTQTGQLRGATRLDGGAEFLGIPYAQPPVGDLRWHEPLAAKPWSGTRDATAFGAPCAQPDLGDWNQHDAQTGQEDCLFLNVITPEWPVKKPLPVMLWLHGGANEGGTASSALYKDGTLAHHGVVLVTVNYRLGIFGFMAHPALTAESTHHASGNYGLADQILALHWVIDNIARFGGDPRNITVFGQSAGAIDTGMLMTSALSKHLFQRAIEESGASLSVTLTPLAQAEQNGETLAASLKAPAGDAGLKALRLISAKDLLADLAILNPHPHFGPDMDGWIVAESPAAVFQAGQEAPIPLLYGVTTREFGAGIFGMSKTPDGVRTSIALVSGNLAQKVWTAYGLADGGQGAADPKYGSTADQWAADMVFRCPAVMQGALHSAARQPTFEYEFNRSTPGQETAVHSSELPYVMGYFPKAGNIGGVFSEVDLKLADVMETYWTNFARSGDPNSAAVPEWPPLGESRAYVQFQQDGRVVQAAGLRSAQCKAFGEVLAGNNRR